MLSLAVRRGLSGPGCGDQLSARRRAGLAVSEVRTARRSLREVFLELTGGRTGGADSVRRPSRSHRGAALGFGRTRRRRPARKGR